MVGSVHADVEATVPMDQRIGRELGNHQRHGVLYLRWCVHDHPYDELPRCTHRSLGGSECPSHGHGARPKCSRSPVASSTRCHDRRDVDQRHLPDVSRYLHQQAIPELSMNVSFSRSKVTRPANRPGMEQYPLLSLLQLARSSSPARRMTGAEGSSRVAETDTSDRSATTAPTLGRRRLPPGLRHRSRAEPKPCGRRHHFTLLLWATRSAGALFDQVTWGCPYFEPSGSDDNRRHRASPRVRSCRPAGPKDRRRRAFSPSLGGYWALGGPRSTLTPDPYVPG